VRLRDFQVYAPHAPREINLQLSVISEIVVHWVRRRPRPVGPISKLVVALYASALHWQGSDWIAWSDGIGELRITDARVAHPAEVGAAGVDAVVRGFRRARDEGVEVDLEGLARDVLPVIDLPGPHAIELEKLAFRDPWTRVRYAVWYVFGPNAAEIQLRTSAGGAMTVVSSDRFVSLDLLFRASKRRVVDGVVHFASHSGVEAASVSLPGP
jgi:hypothetical protein